MHEEELELNFGCWLLSIILYSDATLYDVNQWFRTVITHQLLNMKQRENQISYYKTTIVKISNVSPLISDLTMHIKKNASTKLVVIIGQ